jgi:exosortase
MTSVPQPRPTATLPVSSLPWLSWGLLILSGVVALGPLTPTWNDNPNYSFGWWIPLVCLFLLVERWPQRPPRADGRPVSVAWLLPGWGLLFFAFRLAGEADPDWRYGLWILVGLYVAALLTWVRMYGGPGWLRYFSFPIGFLFLSLPWFFEIEYPLVQGLMRWNAVLVSTSLQGLSIDARPAGNIIHLPNCDLGVEEACSGILSLQASLMMGLLLGEIYRLSVRRRVALVLISMSLALLGNYLRTLSLALIAFYSGTDETARWHDTAGYSILVLTGAGSWLAALGLAQFGIPAAAALTKPRDEAEIAPRTHAAQRLAVAIFIAALASEVCTQAWFAWKESSQPRHPEWTVRLPTNETFKKVTIPDLTLQVLRCDRLQAGQWRDAQGLDWTVYWFHYDPKPYTRVVLGWHTPDNCLPSVGYKKDRDYPNFNVEVNGINLLVRPKKFLLNGASVYLFWVVYANRGNLPPETDTRISLPFLSKLRLHATDVWQGNRGVGVETMEVALSGAPDYDSARTAYLTGLRSLIVPLTSGGIEKAETSHE